jgi:hypothetical protein
VLLKQQLNTHTGGKRAAAKLLPDFNPLEKRQQLFLLRGKLVGEVGGAKHAESKAARHEMKQQIPLEIGKD